jgi:class 3 adenylate cyclase/predicted ATPase
MDVGVWLRSLGLGQYEAAFRDNEIDGAVLPKLTVEDLKDVGVAVVGHRRKIISAIEELNASSSGRAEGVNAVPTQRHVPVSASSDAAERRPITVMFCDLVGSTSLAARLDAEDWRNLVGSYLDEASAAVTGLGGHVLKKLGDGLMALFGYPQAQENDAERAVRAALAIQRALADLNAKNAGTRAPQLIARIGLESGQLVVDATGEVFGEAPNIAARVQALAEPGTVLITARVQRQVAGLFVAEDRGAQTLKGAPELTTLFRVVRASGAGRRGGARALTPLVGREEELDLLSRRWERARQGEGQLALIVGEPGIGKSRLIEEFHACLAETPYTWVEWSSSQLLQNTPLHPVAEWGRLRFGADLPAEQRLADLENTLQLVGLDAAEYAPLIAPLVAVALPEDRQAKLAPEELRRRQLAAMTALVLAGARSQPAVIAFEDLHWADPTSLDLMRALAERGAQAPLLLIATTRPEFRPPWSVRSHHSAISLAPLDRAQVAKMVGELASRHALSKEVVEGVSERTGGVPLFVEEVTRLLLERGTEGGAQAIPPTLQQSLAARLDRLGPAREIAQIGAVLGRSFSYALLQAVAAVDDRGAALSERGYNDPGLRTALDRLAEADILFVEGDGAHANYRFKHALIQDAAYESLLKSRRQALHLRAAEALRDQPERAAAEPEAVAHHFTQAGLDDLAIEWWGKAGDQALRRSAFQEAIAHLGKAIAMAEARAGAPEKEKAGGKLKLQVALGNALMTVRGQGAPEAQAAFERARVTASAVENAPERLSVTYGLYAGAYLRGELGPMREHASAFLRGVAAQPDSPEAGVAHRANGITAWCAGNFADARRHLEQALAIFNPNRDSDLAFSFGHDPGVAAMAYLSLTLWPLGEVDRARQLVAGMMRRTIEITHAGTICFANMHAGYLEIMRGDPIQTEPCANALARLARDHDLKMWTAFGVFLEGWTARQAGARDAGLAGMRDGVSQLAEQGVVVFDGLIKTKLAQAEADDGAIVAALTIIGEAIAVSERTGHRWCEAEICRTRGEILFKQNSESSAPAEEAFLASIAIAQAQKARSFELRAALSLAKLYRSTDRALEAHAALSPALEGFSPTPEMPEIAEAQALLATLSQTDEARNAAARRKRQIDLQLSYGNALIAARGHGAGETTAAFARARELATGIENPSERLSTYYGLWAGSFVRGGELAALREASSAALELANRYPGTGEAAVALRMQGTTYWYQGDFPNARLHLERALAMFDPERDGDLAFRFGQDIGVSSMNYLALALWPIGEIGRARELQDAAIARARETDHVATTAYAASYRSIFEMMRHDASAAEPYAAQTLDLGRQHGLSLYVGYGAALSGWVRAQLGDRSQGVAQMRDGLNSLRQQGFGLITPLYYANLAALEAELGEVDSALGTLDRTLAEIERTDHRTFDAEIHRIRGEILLKHNPSNPAPAEEAFLASIAIAQAQKARSFELRAAHALAKLYQSTGRPADAHAVLASALEEFQAISLLPSGRRAGDEGPPGPADGAEALTPDPSPERERGDVACAEMPELAEAQALLAALAATEEVKADAARRQRLAQLHAAYGNALIAARGPSARETTEAFARARESASGDKDATERLAADFGLWLGSYQRGELPSMRTQASAFLSDVEARPDSPEAGVAHRNAGATCWFAGEYREARDHFERALALFQPGRDDDLAFRFGADPGVAAMAYLTTAWWPLGEVDRAISFIDRMQRRMADLTHVGTLAYGRLHAALFELMRDNQARAAPHAFELARLAREHDLSLFRAYGAFLEGWVNAASGAIAGGLEDMRRGVELLREQNVLMFDGLLKIALAEAEARAGDPDRAVAILDQALATCDRLDYRAFEAELHRARGEIPLKRDPSNAAPAEDAFLTAIAVAKQQGTRSFELRAALALAKLY